MTSLSKNPISRSTSKCFARRSATTLKTRALSKPFRPAAIALSRKFRKYLASRRNHGVLLKATFQASETTVPRFKGLLVPITAFCVLFIGTIFIGYGHMPRRSLEADAPVLSAPFASENSQPTEKVFTPSSRPVNRRCGRRKKTRRNSSHARDRSESEIINSRRMEKTSPLLRGNRKTLPMNSGLVKVDIESGAERELTAGKFFNIKNLAWLPNQSSRLLAAKKISEALNTHS